MHVLWFVPSFGDERRLGDPEGAVPPTLEHLVTVARTAEAAGFEAMLVPAGAACMDGWIVASTLAQQTERIGFMVAFRPGFVEPPVRIEPIILEREQDAARDEQRRNGAGGDFHIAYSPAYMPPGLSMA